MKKITVKELIDSGIINIYNLDHFDVFDKSGNYQTWYRDVQKLLHEFNNYEVTRIDPGDWDGMLRMEIKEN